MPTGVYPDGDYTVAQPDGPPNYSAPFPTDPKPYLYKQRYQQFRENFTTLALDTPGPFGGVHVGEDGFKGEDGGVQSWNREFAFVPALRNEYESFIYSFQLVHPGFCIIGLGGSSCSQPSIAELPTDLTTRIQYEYIQTTNPSVITLPRAPRAAIIDGALYFLNGYKMTLIGFAGGWSGGINYTPGQSVLYGGHYYVSIGFGSGHLPTDTDFWIQYPTDDLFIPGQEVLAEDAQLRIWKGNIYERKQRFVKWIDFQSAIG